MPASQASWLVSLEPAIAPNPITVSPHTPVTRVLELLSQPADSSSSQSWGCVLVVEQNQPLGIITPLDVVSLLTDESNLAQLTAREVMSKIDFTVTKAECQDIFTIINILLGHNLQHLPIVDRQQQLVGLITAMGRQGGQGRQGRRKHSIFYISASCLLPNVS